MKQKNIVAITLMVVLAIATTQLQAQKNDSISSSSTSNWEVEAKILRFAGNRCLLTEVGAVVSDDGIGSEGKITYFHNRWGISLHGRYIPDRSGLGVSVFHHLRSYLEAWIQPYVEVGFGLFQQYVGVKDDITVDDINKGTGNLKHQFMVPMLRPQAEAGLGLEFRLSQRSSLKLYGRAGWRFCEKDKLSINNNINFDNSKVETGKLENFGSDKLTYNVGITYQIRIFPGRKK